MYMCPAYNDLIGNLTYYDIVRLKLEMGELFDAAVVMRKVKIRLETFNK